MPLLDEISWPVDGRSWWPAFADGGVDQGLVLPVLEAAGYRRAGRHVSADPQATRDIFCPPGLNRSGRTLWPKRGGGRTVWPNGLAEGLAGWPGQAGASWRQSRKRLAKYAGWESRGRQSHKGLVKYAGLDGWPLFAEL